MARSFSIRHWEKQLRELGYSRDHEARGSFSKTAGVRKLFISKSSQRWRGSGLVRINLNICCFVEPDLEGDCGFWEVVLQGELRRSAPPIISNGGGDLWGPEEADAALRATIEYGLPWLEQFSHPATLVEYYETCLRDGIRVEHLQLPSIFKTLYSNVDRSETGRRPPVFNWYLAKLHLELGLSDSSRRYAEKYLAWLPDNQHWRRERTLVLHFIGRLPHE
jgi:hypothetical protein